MEEGQSSQGEKQWLCLLLPPQRHSGAPLKLHFRLLHSQGDDGLPGKRQWEEEK